MDDREYRLFVAKEAKEAEERREKFRTEAKKRETDQRREEDRFLSQAHMKSSSEAIERGDGYIPEIRGDRIPSHSESVVRKTHVDVTEVVVYVEAPYDPRSTNPQYKDLPMRPSWMWGQKREDTF